MKGVFITFEGSEGCGKSTQSKMLYDFLRKASRGVIYLREPGGTLISETIRKILLDAQNNAMVPECELLLYMAARAQIVGEIILPALESGKIVICDRFLDSTLAYQGYGLGVDLDLIRYIGKFSTQGIKPDLTIFLDLPVKKGLDNRGDDKDRIEQRSYEYHQKVRRGYLTLAKDDPERFKVVKVAKEKSVTQDNIRRLVLEFFAKE